MNSLELINREIQYWQKTINTARSEKLTQTIIVSLNPLYKVENATLSDYDILLIEEKLQKLQQIKSVLEAWEETKKYIIVKEGRVALYDSTYEYIELKNGCIDESNSEEEGISIMFIKKALEVDNSVKWVEHTLKDFKK